MPTLVYRKRGRPNAFVFGAQDTPITIGRNTNCVIVVDSAGVSRQHAEIISDDDGKSWKINDLGSVNGTFVNGERVTERVLVDKDVVSCGEFLMEFRRGPGSGRVHMSLHTEQLSLGRSNSASVAMTNSQEFSVEEAPSSTSRHTLETMNLEPDTEVGPLLRRIHELESQNQTLEDEILLLRKTIASMRQRFSAQSVEVELPMESTPTVLRAQRMETTVREEFARLLDNVPAPVSSAITSMMDLDRRRNAVLERLLGMIAQMQDNDADANESDEPATDDF